jgi:hypothetical protein
MRICLWPSFLPHPHAGLIAIRELDTGGLESRLSTSADVIGDSLASLPIALWSGGHPNLFGEIGLRPSD